MYDTIHLGRLFFLAIGQVRCAEMNDTRPPPQRTTPAPKGGVLMFVTVRVGRATDRV